MSEPHEPQTAEPNERLEAYLDGLLTAEQARLFEQEIANDPQLQREVELQGKIESSLGQNFPLPTQPVDILAIAAERATAEDTAVEQPVRNTEKPAKKLRTVLMVLAASVAWAVVGWKIFLQSTDDGYRELALADIYQQCVNDGFRPKWVCEDDAEFAGTFQKRQGVPLLMQDDAKDTMVGLSYLKGITSQTTTMLARVDGQPILVFVDKLKRDTRPTKPSWFSGLNLFRLELDDLVLYEITPLDEPRVLASFYIPDPSELSAADAEGSDETGSDEIQ